jgi:hypothetical protein
VASVPDVISKRQRHNVLVRHRGADDPVTVEALGDLYEAQLADHVRRVADAMPPLSDAARMRVATLLLGGEPRE